MKILVIGSDFASCTLAVTVCRNVPNARVTILSLDDRLGLSSNAVFSIQTGKCTRQQAMIIQPEMLQKLGIVVEEKADLLKIDLKAKAVRTAKKQFDYDILVLNFPGVPKCQFAQESADLYEQIAEKRVAVIGAGTFGCQLASDLSARNQVIVFDKAEQPCQSYFDPEFQAKLRESLAKQSVEYISEAVEAVKNCQVTTQTKQYACDVYVNATGLSPWPALAKLLQGQLEIRDGYILTDDRCKTQIANVFCFGQCATNNAVQQNRTDELLMRQAFCIASQIAGSKLLQIKPQTRCVAMQIASKCFMAVGQPAYALGCQRVRVTDNHRAEFMETYEVISLQLNYNEATRHVLGCQLYSGRDVTWLANSISMAVQKCMTVEQLLVCDFFFQPYFGKPWNIINLSCMATHCLPPFEQYKLRKEGQDEIL